MRRIEIAGLAVAIAALAVAIATLFVDLSSWLIPNPRASGQASNASNALRAVEASPENRDAGGRVQTRPGGPIAEDPTKPPSDGHDYQPSSSRRSLPPESPPERLPLELSLADGEQGVILEGKAALAVEFNRVGEEQFVILRIHAGSTSRAHAILGSTATKTYEMELQGEVYVVSVLRIDRSAKSVRLRIDRKRGL